HQLLCAPAIVNSHKTVVALFVTDSEFVQLPRQILAAVDANLNRHRQPRLQSHMHQSKLTIQIVKVKMQTLSRAHFQSNSFRLSVSIDLIGATQFDALENTDQTFFDSILLCDLPGAVFFRLPRRPQIDQWAIGFVGDLFGSLGNGLSNLFRKLFKFFVQKVLLKPFGVLQRSEAATKQNPIKTCYSSNDVAFVPLQKTLHDLTPVIGLFNPILPESVVERYSFWLRPKAAL